MSDLIERLLSPSALNQQEEHELRKLAAAEIERLESRLRDRGNALDHAIDYGHRKDAEIERLKADFDLATRLRDEAVEELYKEQAENAKPTGSRGCGLAAWRARGTGGKDK